jgi:hypothetical protein
VWLYRPTHTKGKSPKLQSSWDGPYKVVTQINDVVYRIQRNPKSRMMVVHLDRLASYQGAAQDELPLRGDRMKRLERITVEEPCHRNVMSRTQPLEEKER